MYKYRKKSDNNKKKRRFRPLDRLRPFGHPLSTITESRLVLVAVLR